MPKIKFEKVISFSSEDPVHVANNLLNNDPAKKWKCRTSGEKQASVVLQLEKPCIISHIDIGNENSAYVEVLVNRSTSTDSYKGLLVMSAFMTAFECRQSTNVNKVRMFSHEELLKPESNEKWDRIKIICTQPFNRHVQYGLSFITLHSLEDKLPNMPSSSNKLGKFTLREESPDNLSFETLFAKRKNKPEDNKLKAAAAIREASSSPNPTLKRNSLLKPLLKDLQSTPKAKKKKKEDDDECTENVVSRNRDAILYADDETAPNDKIDAIINKKNEEMKKRKLEEEDEESKKKDKKIKKDKRCDMLDVSGTSTNGHTNNDKKDTPNKKDKTPVSKKIIEKKKDSNKEEKQKIVVNKKKKFGKPFNDLLNGVTLVISGIQNPERANIRSQSMAMGAKYKADWDKNCTHLICAFTNTPKFNQVKGKGKIVNKMWIEDCYDTRKRLPWRRYALEKAEKQKPESEDEICELDMQIISSPINSDDDDDYKKVDSDTDDEYIPRRNSLENRNLMNEGNNSKNNNKASLYDASTDVGSDRESLNVSTVNVDDIEKFCDIFDGKSFYIDDKLDDNDKKLLIQHITAYNGNITRNVMDDIDVIVTSNENVNEMKKLKKNNNNCLFVFADWVWSCHNEQRYVPSDIYEL